MLTAIAAFALLGPARHPDDLAGYHLVGRFDSGSLGARLKAGALYRYSDSEVPANLVDSGDPARSVIFDRKAVVAAWSGLQPKSRYRLKLVYLSDSDARVQGLHAGPVCLQRSLKLPKSEKLATLVDLPPATYAKGDLELRLEREAGPNAVVSRIEFWSTNARAMPGLTVNARAGGEGRVEVAVADLVGKPAGQVNVDVSLGKPAGIRRKTDESGRIAFDLPSNWKKSENETAIVAATGPQGTGVAEIALEDIFQADPELTPLPGLESRSSLNGTWRATRSPDSPAAAGRKADPQPRDVEVPGELAMEGLSAPVGWVQMERTFAAPLSWRTMRVKIRFDAVYSACRVKMNGTFVGRHVGGFTPFEVDVTRALRFGTVNRISVDLRNDSIADELSSGSRYAAHPLVGITRKVTLFAVPAVHVRSVQVQTPLDPGDGFSVMRVQLQVVNEGARAAHGVAAFLTLQGSDGKQVGLIPSRIAVGALLAGATVPKTVEVAVASPRPWDCEHPTLYTLSCGLEGGSPREATQQRVGFRQVEIRGNELFVNGRPVKLHGVCRHESDPLRGRSLALGEWRRDAELLREMNVNFVRTSHYPPAEEFLEACDELGIFVEEEAPICWCNDASAKARGPILRQTLEMVERDRSRPSVILWSLANESTWSPIFEESSRQVRRLDPTRPQIFSYGGVDVASEHYPSPGRPAEVNQAKKPVLFDEYCHLTVYNRREALTDPGLRDGWGLGLSAMWEKVLGSRGALGGAIWAGVDDLFLLPDGTAGGYGSWGPIDGWRRRKPEFWHVKKTYSPVRVLKTVLAPPEPGDGLTIPVENRHDFTDLNELRIEWEVGTESGTAACDAPPRSRGTLAIQPKQNDLDGKDLTLRFWSPRGFLIDTERIAIGSRTNAAPALSPATERQSHDVTEDALAVSGTAWKWVFDRHTGAIRSAELNGKEVLIGGPTLFAAPMEQGDCAPNYSLDIQPWTPTCSDWQAAKVAMTVGTESTVIDVVGAYKEGSGSYRLTIDRAGTLSVHYKFAHSEAFRPRQIGLVFDAPKTVDILAWRRNAQWTTYPEDHIGRAEGSAQAVPGTRPDPRLRLPPTWTWSQDATPLGSNDFRATRRNVVWESLRMSTGYGVVVRPGGAQHTRAWVDGDRIRLLVADFDNGGGDGVFGQHIEGLRKELPAGSVLEGTVTIELARP